MKVAQIAKRYGAQATALGGVMALPIAAMAALPDSVKNAIDGAKTDGLEAGWLVVGVVAALFVIAIVKRLLR